MDWPEEFVESFPPPRDDEPMSLREDIVDELADHLESALDRQRLDSQDELSARSKVFDRFGDPKRLARQLWFEAMEEKILSQRVSLAINVVLGTVCLFTVGMMWRLMEQAQAATRQLAEENRATTQMLMERLTQLPVPALREDAVTTGSKSLDWNPVRAHLVLGDKDGPPAEGYIVRLSQKQSKMGNVSFETIAEEHTGPDGIADLALVAPGKYVLCAMRGSNNTEWFSTQVNVLPGSAQTVEVVCPPEKNEKVGVVVRIDVPEDLRSDNRFVTAEFVCGPRDFSGSEWRTGFNGAEANDSLAIIIFAPDGRVGMTYQGIMSHNNEGEPIQMFPSDANGEGFRKPEERPISLYKTNYFLRTIRIGPGIITLNPAVSPTNGWMIVKSESHFLPENKRIYPGVFLDYKVASRDLPELQTFHADAGQKNEWQITIPDEVWEKARNDLEMSVRNPKQTPPEPLR